MSGPAVPPQASGLPGGLDAMSVGRSIFGNARLPDSPVVAGYSQVEFLARGGFGCVWRARRNSDGLAVALKVPHDADIENGERLDQEAATLQALDHPHIVRLLELTFTGEITPVLVMELVEGTTLTERLPADGFDFDHAMQIFLPVLEAVAHAHSRGILHRDIKPSNILLSAEGIPKVSDFGLAQSLKDQRVAFSMTRSGVLAGTVEYLAPERYEPGREASPAADIFALGIILYELLTGRPPRGAWQPVSQLRHLDVRLDELLEEAIHPDPAERLRSAALFRGRLEEIRRTRPRYAGTPLLTRAVRTADALWTLGGLYCLGAGFCSLLAINNTKVPALFNLTFGHQKLLGGFWALWILTVLMGTLWGWQAVRVLRFRRIPLREALPSPFGLRLGTTRGSAVLVLFAQCLCAWGPLAYIVWIYSQSWVWVSPETPVWERVLSVTKWGSEDPVSVWTWDPDNFFNGGSYWIREVQPGLQPGTWRLHDRQSFFIFTQPLLMALGAAGIAAGVIVTSAAVLLQWIPRRRAGLGLFLTCLGTSAFSLRETVLHESAMRAEERIRRSYDPENIRLGRERAAQPGIRRLFDSVIPGSRTLAIDIKDYFAPMVVVGGIGIMERADFLTWLAAERLENVTISDLRFELLGPDGPDSVRVEFCYESWPARPGLTGSGSFTRLHCSGSLVPNPPLFLFKEWSPEVTRFPAGELRQPSPTEAAAWTSGLLTVLGTEECPGLESYLMPDMLLIEPSDARSYAAAPCGLFAAAFRSERAGWQALSFSAVSPPAVRLLSGNRWELNCDVKMSGLARSGKKTSAPPLRWQFETIPVGGTLRLLRLRM